MKKLSLLVLLALTLGLKGQKGKTFPQMVGINLNDKIINLPFNNGKFTVIAIAYNKQAEDELKKWLNPLYNLFMKKDKGGSTFDMAEIYDVNFVFIPMISGFKKIVEDFKKGTDKEFWPYIMDTEKTDIKAIQKQLQIEDNKIPYFYVLDKSDIIIEALNGKYAEEKMDLLEEAVD